MKVGWTKAMKEILHRCIASLAVLCAAGTAVSAYAAPPDESPRLETHRVAQAPTTAEKPPESPDSWGRWYAGLHGGPMFLADSQVKGSGLDMDVDFESNFAVGLDIGYRYKSGLRLELEVTFRNSDASSLDIKNDPGIGAFLGIGSLSGLTLSPATGGVHSWSFMLNGWYDFDFLTAPIPVLRNWVPYVGGGLGATRVSIDAGWIDFPFVEASDTVPAWQVGAGLGYKHHNWLVFSVDYRYFSTMIDLEFNDPLFVDPIGASYDTHNVMFTMRGYF